MNKDSHLPSWPKSLCQCYAAGLSFWLLIFSGNCNFLLRPCCSGRPAPLPPPPHCYSAAAAAAAAATSSPSPSSPSGPTSTSKRARRPPRPPAAGRAPRPSTGARYVSLPFLSGEIFSILKISGRLKQKFEKINYLRELDKFNQLSWVSWTNESMRRGGGCLPRNSIRFQNHFTRTQFCLTISSNM